MKNYSQQTLDYLWGKCRPVSKETCSEIETELSDYEYRLDDLGAIIKRSEYGNESEYGWTIDHVFPLSKGGDDNILNLQILHWSNNHQKADDFPTFNWNVSSKVIDKSLRNYQQDRPRLTFSDNVIRELAQIYPSISYYTD